ncbi:hypothetical protein ACI2VK_17265 [Ralstonia nicotianae]|uniref:hypothetical protein n=1 Tax=Ralstonia solanacearum TaxID=305 RepID=UPI00078CC101|nr:hypothetical protein [Ralstonia solanacearum]AMP36039.1 hypothetical protein LBM2029_00105 [Ralstonia solanacearum]AXV84833.1 hypothetical protein CJO78_00120 [Ralstonia solanacearum]AXW04386.1 hypothetical protein CJO82_00120 [Ralstonia solanacearum]AXW22139.1 hypothetical protein CJO86_00120 [Ralstonia solanacearum]AXW79033.1 hypothetical protein CJO98_00120 [Ralstonia solanacearum]
MNALYRWDAPDGTGSIQFSLKPDGIEITAPYGTEFEPYPSITAVSLVPAIGGDAACAIITFNRKEFGLRARQIVWAENPAANPMQAANYDRWIRALHQALIDRQLTANISFRCGTRWNALGWLYNVYPIIRMVALGLIPIGIIAALVTQSWAFATTCVGGGTAMLLMPKFAKPSIPKELQRIRPYSPDAIPEGCLARIEP